MAEKEEILQVVEKRGSHVGATERYNALVDRKGGEMGRGTFQRFHRRGFEAFIDRSVPAGFGRFLCDETPGESDHVNFRIENDT